MTPTCFGSTKEAHSWSLATARFVCRFTIEKAHGWYLNVLPDGRYEVVHADEQLAVFVTPSVLLQVPIVTLGEKTEEGEFVKEVRETWREIVKQVKSRSDFLCEFTTA